MPGESKNILLNELESWIKSDFKDPRTRFMVSQLVETMERQCNECQSDRFKCTFEPLCDDRRWLSLLIEMKVPRRFLPQFCFSRRREEIGNLLKKKSIPTPLIDAVFPLRDFFMIFMNDLRGEITQSNIDEILERLVKSLQRKWNSIDIIHLRSGKIVMLFDVSEVIVILDVPKGLAYVNVHVIGINSDEEYIELASKLTELLNADTKIINPYPGTFYIHIFLSNNDMGKEELEKTCSYLNNVRISKIGDKIRITYNYSRNKSALFASVFDLKNLARFLNCIKSQFMRGDGHE